MTTVNHILEQKGQHVVSVEPTATVFDAIGTMAKENIGAVVIMENQSINGIFTERDYLRKIALKFRSSRETIITDVMTSPVITAKPDDSIKACLEVMTQNRCRHLPVVDDSDLLGIVSIGDLVRQSLLEKQEEVDQLSHYIQGSY